MQINTVKQSGQNFVVNGLISVPNSADNSGYQTIQKWISKGGIVEAEFTAGELLSNAKTSKISQCKSYLTSTDWYAIRKADNGTAIPTEIETNRESARILQDEINDCTTIEEVNAINITF
jgi:hypothetical protein